ncbi:MAG: hypothetical protein JO207_05070 [Verrucomicrobia bacterium]|nr:hypothetical protein [Verrucomicrobiota bacterium]
MREAGVQELQEFRSCRSSGVTELQELQELREFRSCRIRGDLVAVSSTRCSCHQISDALFFILELL